MSSFRERAAAFAAAGLMMAAAGAAAAQGANYPGIGRAATPAEVKAWDIDVRPDFKGLPKGQGSVAQGQDIWEARCASCHGVFGESNEVFTPLVGGTTADDVRSGRVARLNDPAFPGRTTLMKVATVSTLWDYIHRAMPWNQPKSLKPDEVYAVTAFLLNLGGVVPDNFVLSDRTMAEAQARLPNRLGMTTAHAMWPGRSLPGTVARPDTQAKACMKDCVPETATVKSQLPDFARNAHGNLAEQNRMVGAQKGAQTATVAAAAAVAATAAKSASVPTEILSKNGCTACHAQASKLVGPSFKDIAGKHGARPDAVDYLVGKIREGGVGVWGPIPMPEQALSADDARAVARWLQEGAKP